MRALAAAVLASTLLSGCAQRLPSRALASFASAEAWCNQLRGATCKGEWAEGHAGNTALGPYRFLVIEAGAVDNFGGGPSVSLELKTTNGFVYEPMGAIGATGRAGNTVLNVESISDHDGVVDLRTHARAISPAGMSDTQEASLFIEGSSGVGVAHIHLGTNTRDELGRAKGGFGELTWNGGTLVSHGTSLKDGEYRLAAP